uniref:ubiquitinyl hydrolase 1 n=1 Tax=Oryza rufipogon TaxID=4529 RepID=A0A0E0NMX1_ORYRU
MCEKDQNFHWGYDLFRDPFAPIGYYGPPHGYGDGNYCDLHYARDASHLDETHLHSSALTYDLYNPSVGIYHPGNAGEHDHDTVYIEPTSSNSCPDTDDSFPMDEEVGKRFYPMVPVPHVPKINGEIPSVDEATMDHERLTERLRLYELVEHKVKGDGNCQFRALSDQLYQSPDHHEFVRQQIMSQLKSNRDAYDGYVPMAYDDYLEKVSQNGEWGDHVTLQAAADKYGVKIFVMTSFKDTCYIEIQPKVQKSNKVVLLSFWAEVHYNSIYPQNDDEEEEMVAVLSQPPPSPPLMPGLQSFSSLIKMTQVDQDDPERKLGLLFCREVGKD